MRRTVWLLVVPVLLCCSGRGRQTGAHAADKQPPPKLARLAFALAQAQPADKAAHEAGATLYVQALRGADSVSYWGKMSSEMRSSPQMMEPQGGAVATITDKSFPSLRVAARARLREDGLIAIGYSIESLADAGVLAGAKDAAPQRLSSGSTLDGEVLLAKAGTFALGEIHDAHGAKLDAKLTVEVTSIE